MTKRANSVLAVGEPGDLGAAVADAERFYASVGLPCVFTVGGGAAPGLDAELDARGYRLVDPTLVMTAPLCSGVPSGLPVGAVSAGESPGTAGVVPAVPAVVPAVPGVVPAVLAVGNGEAGAAGGGDRLDAGGDRGGHRTEVALATRPSEEWLDAWWSVDGRVGAGGKEMARRILTGVPACYASGYAAGEGSRGQVGTVGGAGMAGPECTVGTAGAVEPAGATREARAAGGASTAGGGGGMAGGADAVGDAGTSNHGAAAADVGRARVAEAVVGPGGVGPGGEGPVVVGRGVRQKDWWGIYCMAVVPGARRRGHALGVLRALLSQGRRQGAKQAYLVVTESNAVARTLYERAGFTVSARYHYRVR
ncbi:GNAT family N-acetyltransferase [Streptosporangium sp. KLBMP 9127]|nr:GNAT family N-acetyltransferase [Streptosporangium sp. KLBMP 9127]